MTQTTMVIDEATARNMVGADPVDPVVQRLQAKLEKKKQNYLEARSKKIDKVLRGFLNKHGWDGTIESAITIMRGWSIAIGYKGEVFIQMNPNYFEVTGEIEGENPLTPEFVEQIKIEAQGKA